MSLRELLYRGADPYAGSIPDEAPEDLQGWGSDHAILAEAVHALRPRLIVEIGSWKGRSALRLAEAAHHTGLACEILCVDTWLGSAEHWIWPEAPHHADAARVYDIFRANMLRRGVAHIVTPLRLTSDAAAQILLHHDVRPELIYLDAAHDEASVSADLAAWWPLVAPGGALIGDDYLTWPSVTLAADRFAATHGLPLFGEEGKFVLRKTGPRPLREAFAPHA